MLSFSEDWVFWMNVGPSIDVVGLVLWLDFDFRLLLSTIKIMMAKTMMMRILMYDVCLTSVPRWERRHFPRKSLRWCDDDGRECDDAKSESEQESGDRRISEYCILTMFDF